MLGAALRFPTLDRQSFWLDELVTVSLLDRGLGDVLREIPRTEATPFVYYVVAWAWRSIFGLGEVGLRSLSALAGTATIPVAYGAGAVLVSRRAGLVAAALVAINPFLVWYSQEARSYALLALLGAAIGARLRSRASRGPQRGWPGGRLVSALAIATHYFAVFLVAAEAVWLLVRLRPRRPVVARVARTGGRRSSAHLPLVLAQRGNAEAVAGSSLVVADRGDPEEPRRRLQLSRPRRSAARSRRCSSSSGVVLVARLAPGERRGALIAGSLALAAILTPVAARPRRASTSSSPGTRSPPSSRPPCASGPGTRRGGSGSRRRPCCACSRPPSRWPRRSTRRTAAPTGAARPRRSRRPSGTERSSSRRT